ncbi:uncharacterized protein LY89DRAFT_684764 [Mollisia scopiformis]|uniref:Uncharacterized protein n=1 Tax=Mollisia scopiformis TaxID=149040 RepID=A0A194XCF7_MOLSC|nr:uncharacterized protein LY89DRAFT_684764 [Mollisia scopiformis]KUJ17841.1 hypothetical protein LY89DRAFT_684764 [Mollisia scopiformis]
MSVLLIALICHEFGGNRYSSPLLSFCAMLSVKLYTKTWKEPGNYNSCLSSVIWVVQLIIFHTSACLEKAELGEILGWRLLLFIVSKEVVLTYRDVDLHIDHVPRLLLSDF